MDLAIAIDKTTATPTVGVLLLSFVLFLCEAINPHKKEGLVPPLSCRYSMNTLASYRFFIVNVYFYNILIFLFVDQFELFDKRIQVPLEIWFRESGIILTNIFCGPPPLTRMSVPIS